MTCRTHLFLATILVSLAMICASPSLADNDWPRWRGASGTGVWEGAPDIAAEWPESLPVAWRVDVGPGFSGVAVAGNRVYTMDRQSDSHQERVLCLDRNTGAQVWTHAYQADYGKLDYGKGPRSTPTIHNGRAYTLGAVGHLHCLDTTTGKVLWSKDLVRDHQAQQPTWGFAASPVVYRDQLIVHAGMKPGGTYAAFDLENGKELWRAGQAPTGYATPILATHQGRNLLIGWTPTHVIGISLDERKVVWKEEYKVTYGVSIATPIVVKDIVLVCGYWEGSKAIRLGDRPGSTTLLWEENRFLRGLMAQPLERDGYGYLLDKHHGIVCFELETGKKVWSDGNRLTPRARNPQATMVWLGDSDRVLSLNASGELVQIRLTPKGYEELSRASLVGETWAHPAFAGRQVFARDDKQLVCAALPVRDSCDE